MTPNADDFLKQVAGLGARFAGLAARLGEAARDLQMSGVLPPGALLEELAAARTEFMELREGVLEAASALSVDTPPPAAVDGLKALEPLIQAVAATIAGEERRRAVAEARRRSLAVLDRVLAVVHVDDPGFAALAQAKARAQEIRQAVADPKAFESESAAAAIVDSTPAFTALLTLIEGRDLLDDDRFGSLEDTVSQSFGRSLAVAATRGKLAIAGGAAPAAAPAAERPAPPRLEEPARPAPPPAAAPVEDDAAAARAVEQSAQDETAQWWVSAWARWTSWKSTLSFADAVKQELTKYNYLLSVPILKSADYDDGLLSYGYSILLEYIERQSPGFVAKALNSLKTFAPGVPDQPRTVGEYLYRCLVTEGRLAEQYGEFVKNVLLAAVPEPGLWTTARVLESTMETRVFTHPSNRIGDTEHNSQRLTQDRQRFTDHRFQIVLPPLTARFFAVAADLKEPRGIDAKLFEGRNDVDQAWLLTMPPAGRADLKSELVRLAPEGTSLPGLGRDYATLWIAVYNSDPNAEKRYELTLGLRKDAKPAGTYKAARTA
ncbi:MAG: hypothetical protein HY616_10880 [Candidatus Rokubacteria bacterium]|nr:hypothetical protein [Candidatus Rokubacteria bacterium]MBI4255564.1 hypothetical protein [Candidatus Rokubacteria bacterium]